jgi:hypothetical protein
MQEDLICWAALYEVPFVEHLARFSIALGVDKTIVAAAASKDPLQHMFRAVTSGSLDDIKPVNGVRLGQPDQDESGHCWLLKVQLV